MVEPKRDNRIESLSSSFRKKFDPRWAEVKSKHPDASIFEARRSKERQKRLYGVGRTHSFNRKPVTRTLNSRHLLGNAVDIVFLNSKGQPTRQGPYDDLIVMAEKYGIRNLKPTETCHFEDDGKSYKSVPQTTSVPVVEQLPPIVKQSIFSKFKEKLQNRLRKR